MSKGLEALKDIRDICSNMTTVFDDDLGIIEKELKRLEELEIMYSNCVIEGAKQKKALEIIIKHSVNVERIKNCSTFEQYNLGKPTKDRRLTKEEFDLLKEVLL